MAKRRRRTVDQINTQLVELLGDLEQQPNPDPYVRDAASFLKQTTVCLDKHKEVA